ncbi:stimulator of interferon genes protein homolog isoform X2 [Haemaphysalis longicornis]
MASDVDRRVGDCLDLGIVPARRKNRWPLWLFTAQFIGFLVVLLLCKPVKEVGVHVAVAAVSVAVVVVARQSCYMACELYWLPVKSVGSASKMLKQCSKLPYSTLTVFGACIIMSFLIVIENLSLLWDIISTAGYVHFLVALINTLCVWNRTQHGWAMATSNEPVSGEGMALYLFYTYHKQVSLTLRERMVQYEQDNGVRLAVRKLLILMPMSCYIEPVLGSGGDEDIEVANPMDDLVLSRGGTQARTYNNTVYKIRNGDDRPYYVVAEGANPLLTLNDMRECGELTAEQLQEQMINFFDKMHELVHANAACRSSILLVPYRDTTQDGTPIPVSSVVRNAIRKELGLA